MSAKVSPELKRKSRTLSLSDLDVAALNSSANIANVSPSQNVRRLLEMEKDLDAFITAYNEGAEGDANWAFIKKYFKKGE